MFELSSSLSCRASPAREMRSVPELSLLSLLPLHSLRLASSWRSYSRLLAYSRTSVPYSTLEHDLSSPSSPLSSLKMDDLHCNSLKCRKALGFEASKVLGLPWGARN